MSRQQRRSALNTRTVSQREVKQRPKERAEAVANAQAQGLVTPHTGGQKTVERNTTSTAGAAFATAAHEAAATNPGEATSRQAPSTQQTAHHMPAVREDLLLWSSAQSGKTGAAVVSSALTRYRDMQQEKPQVKAQACCSSLSCFTAEPSTQRDIWDHTPAGPSQGSADQGPGTIAGTVAD